MVARNWRHDVQEWIQTLSEKHIPSMVVYSTAAFSLVLGAIFFIDAETFRSSLTFSATFEYVSPQVLGGALGLTGLLMGWLYWLDGSSGRAPAFVLMVLYMLLGFTAGVAPLSGIGGVLSASAVYTFVGIVAAICIFACVPRRDADGKAARDHF